MWFDILTASLLVIAVIFGIINGAIRELFSLGGVVAGIYFASRFYTKLASILHVENVRVISFIIIFVVIAIAVYLVGLLLYQMLHFLKLGGIDRFMGIVLGIVKATLLAGIICLFASLLPDGRKTIEKSKCAPFILKELYYAKQLFPLSIQEKMQWHTPRE